MSTLVEEIVPQELGIDPIRFPGWRPGQYQIFMDTMDCQTRFSGHCAPCGFGKSLCMICYALTTGSRTLILTPFKGLQDQLGKEFPDTVTDLKGKANYYCMTMQTNCEMGAPRCDVRNSIMGAGLCDHKAATNRAIHADIVVTNYSCWFHQMYGQGIGEFDTIIMDEADAAESALSEFLSFSLSSKEALGDSGKNRAPHWNDPLRAWIEWAKEAVKPMRSMVAQAERDAKESDDRRVLERFFHLRNLFKKLATLAEIQIEDWVCEPAKDGIRFDPIWPGKFAEKYLFRGIKRVILFSGTLNRKAFELLGVRQDQYTFYDYDSPFHPARNPLILAPLGNFRYPIAPQLMIQAIDFFDNLVDQRKNVKGILHTISFDHLEQFIERSRHVNLFISNDVKYAGGMRRTENVVESFKEATAPAVLASPSITSGWDFPDDFCRYQFILKVPFPTTQSTVAKARKKLDPEYHDNLAMTSLIQMCSRPCRSVYDYNENIITDVRVGWFLANKKHLAAKWFLGARGSGRYRRLNEGVVPEPIRG